MSFGFASVEHAIASVAHDAVVAAKKIGPLAATAATALTKAGATAPAIEAVTGLVSPQAAEIERAAFSALGSLVKACSDVSAAAGGNGVNVPLDAQAIADFKTLGGNLSADLAAVGMKL